MMVYVLHLHHHRCFSVSLDSIERSIESAIQEVIAALSALMINSRCTHSASNQQTCWQLVEPVSTYLLLLLLPLKLISTAAT